MVSRINKNHMLVGNKFKTLLKSYVSNTITNDNKFFAPVKPSIQHSKSMHNPFLFSQFGVDPDYDRFNKIIKGKAREELKKFISPEKMNIIKGGKVVQLPKHVINTPHFTRGNPDEGGVGQGDGDVGDEIGQIGKDGKPGPDAGEEDGEHIEEEWGPEITRSEIARMFMEDLSLPNLEPKGNKNIKETNIKWVSISHKGSKIHIKSTLKNAIKRTAIEKGERATPEDVVPLDEDIRYYDWQIVEKPHANAVIIYMMDVSGSMGEEQKEIARTASFYLSTIIQHQFGELNSKLREEAFTDDKFGEGVEEVFIIHDAEAKEVTEKEFYTTRESGGTKISSAYKKAEEIIKARYDPQFWNIYIFHYSDGDNWGDDTPESINTMDRLLPHVNEIGYIQIKSSYGDGEFKNNVDGKYGSKHIKVRTSKIEEPSSEQFTHVIYDMLGNREEKK